MKDTGRTWLTRDETRLTKSWKDIKKDMLTKFRPKGTAEHYMRAIYQREFKTGETINEYYNSVVTLYDILESLGKSFSEHEKADKLIGGLKGPMREKVMFMKPTTPDEFLVEAHKIVANMNRDGTLHTNGKGLMTNDVLFG